MAEYPTFGVSRRHREPLLKFIVDALESDNCRIIFVSGADEAPFRITFETPTGERLGIIAYAFFANSKQTKNRPSDEHRFQVKYGSKDGRLHDFWQDPFGLYTTLLVGIDPELGIFVGADPVLHSPTRFFISIEFKRPHVESILRSGWYFWERDRRQTDYLTGPVECLIGGTQSNFLRYVRFEREALGEDQGHRQLLAERSSPSPAASVGIIGVRDTGDANGRLHILAEEFDLSETEVLDLIANARRLKMAVRGWVAEEYLVRHLRSINGVSDCVRLDDEGGPDIQLRFGGSRFLTIECKNVLRQRTATGIPRLDFQRTRASKADPCSRYYSPTDLDAVAACLHAVSEHWEFRFILSMHLDEHRTCEGKLSSAVRVDERWSESAAVVLADAAKAIGIGM
jgi:hypothetical protein